MLIPDIPMTYMKIKKKYLHKETEETVNKITFQNHLELSGILQAKLSQTRDILQFSEWGGALLPPKKPFLSKWGKSPPFCGEHVHTGRPHTTAFPKNPMQSLFNEKTRKNLKI